MENTEHQQPEVKTSFSSRSRIIDTRCQVHLITKGFLDNLGINTATVDPRSIKIYSHGGKPLPLLNSKNNTLFDLPQNAIQIIGQEDGSFDGADQIDSDKYVIKGGGGALLRENILFSLAKKVVVMADKTKFVKKFTRTVPIEIHPLARNSVINSIKKLGGESKIRSLDRGYPFFTENGNIILDCDFGIISNPKTLTQKIKQTTGVLESGIFLRKPDIIYKANTNGKFEII